MISYFRFMKHCKGSDNKRSHRTSPISRRELIKTLGMGAAGMLMSPYLFANSKYLFGDSEFLTQVAITNTDNYSQSNIRQKVQHLFESLGGISDIVKPGDKVAIKINITGGSNWANHSQLQGVDIRECAWTHPEVLRAVAELLIDSGVSGNNIYFVEAIWDWPSYNSFGYRDIQNQLGAQVVNLNVKDPYSSFINKSTGSGYYFYNSFILNRILDEVDVFVSIPKMKQHYEAGMTHSMKNLVGITPLEHYQMPSQGGIRSKLHSEGGEVAYHLPRSICDLNMARPVHLAVIDGIKNAIGGEGPWNATFTPHEHHVLIAGKDPVATDSVATHIMGHDPEAEQLQKPSGMMCDNHLFLANQKGMGTNKLNDIELVGDGAGGVFGIEDHAAHSKTEVLLFQNYPNPFTSSTTISFYLPAASHISIKILDISGKEVGIIAEKQFDRGKHDIIWNRLNHPAGIYFYQLKTSAYTQMRKMILR